MGRFDPRHGTSRPPGENAGWNPSAPPSRDDATYPGDEFGGTYADPRQGREAAGSPYEGNREVTGGRDYRPGDDFAGGARADRGEGRHPGHRDFGGHHAYDTHGRQPGRREFGRGEPASLHGGEGRDWSASGYPGGHHGVGPKGYRRTDERIHEDLCERLSDHDAIDASNIEVQVNAGVVTLSGAVPRRYMKHLAEDAVADAIGVKDVENTLRVRDPTAGNGRDTPDEASPA